MNTGSLFKMGHLLILCGISIHHLPCSTKCPHLTLLPPITSLPLMSPQSSLPSSKKLSLSHSFLIPPLPYSSLPPSLLPPLLLSNQPTMSTTTTNTTSLNSLHRSNFLPHSNPFPQKLYLPSHSSPTSLSLSKATTIFSLLTPTTPSTASSPSFDTLAGHLATSDFRQADEETRRLLIALAGEQAIKRGYVFFSEVQFIDPSDLRQIDTLWRMHSSNRFGYSIQKRIWEKKVKKDFTRFFIKVGWMKKLDTEVEQWNYRSFPSEFIWEMEKDGVLVPEGHLPLTNALRGTQLLTSILTHPAFEEEGEDGVEEEEVVVEGVKKGMVNLIGGGNRNFKTDYSF